ncbi:MAG: hypothetical protein HGA72_06780 [Chlorobiaceae bacterium]|nr:hypothetical protein [Chlorobiaceae bacterium]
MPVTKLFVEGNLDIELLNPILGGAPMLQQGGSKNSLKPRTLTEYNDYNVVARYLRDRDFDYDPPAEISKPIVDYEKNGIPIGWRWCRHEIENYLIEPALIGEAMKLPVNDIENALRNAASKIRDYEAARWTIGTVRRALPPHYELNTRPDTVKKEIELPSVLDATSLNDWALSTIETYWSRFTTVTDTETVHHTFKDFIARFDDNFIKDVCDILLWFSGKDILAGLAEWLMEKGIKNPGLFRALLRDWVIANPERTLELLPEWKGLIEILRV